MEMDSSSALLTRTAFSPMYALKLKQSDEISPTVSCSSLVITAETEKHEEEEEETLDLG